ncbi:MULTISPECIES: hypothetical protein [Providencia]|uniref:hypothetical protein n=1 Tax=Providencia TaxID=586 RepID=UPI0015EB5027|nr:MULTISPECIES: hypothetical protein [Providencia]ELR5139225.1 hypothetical protein [Providencia rettgeri]QLQ93650.1 hypothetical protein H0907_20805 [Providencia rettgeri]WEB84268.1 hypothetical protein LVJ10_20825 [Providencia rettgeri]HCH7934596.1 hypothetical protein [Providencia rettgeri]HEM6858750.1 hypothetical protein [Providencia rettgeri]
MNLVSDWDVQQFTCFPCDMFSQDFLEHCQQGMTLKNEREVPVTDKMFLVIVSQTCDISNNGVSYIEGFIFTKAKSKQVKDGERIKHTRNYQKILINEPVSGDDRWFLIKKDKRFFLDKALLIHELVRVGDSGKFSFLKDNRAMLLEWLIKSYTRAALPDGFNKAFIDDCRDKEHPVHLFLIHNRENIIDIFVFCTPLDDEDAERYDVTFTALVSYKCDDETKESLADEFKAILEEMSRESSKLNLLQLGEGALDEVIHEGALMDFVLSADEFTKKDEYLTHRLNLDFICFMSSGSE